MNGGPLPDGGGPLLSTFPTTVAPTLPATPERLGAARALLVPHDGGPVRDVQGRPDRWALLSLLGRARRLGVPTLGWGGGAGLVGRAAGGAVDGDGRCLSVPGWTVLERGEDGAALRWTLGAAHGYAGETLPAGALARFLAALPLVPTRHPASALEAIGGPAPLRAVLDDFYARCRADPLLGPTFAAHVHDWPAHMDGVQRFWETMLGGGAVLSGGAVPDSQGPPPWRGNLNRVHAGLGVRREQVERWLALFGDACRAQLPPEGAGLLLSRARVMGARLGPGGAGGAGR